VLFGAELEIYNYVHMSTNVMVLGRWAMCIGMARLTLVYYKHNLIHNGKFNLICAIQVGHLKKLRGGKIPHLSHPENQNISYQLIHAHAHTHTHTHAHIHINCNIMGEADPWLTISRNVMVIPASLFM
jgi:hypothetical protein